MGVIVGPRPGGGGPETDPNAVHLTGDQTVAGVKTFTGAVYVKEDPWIDPRSGDYGDFDADPAAAVQSALTAWSQTSHPNPKLKLPPGLISHATPFTGGRKRGIIEGYGRHTELRYTGPGGVAAFLFENLGQVRLSDFTVAPQPPSGSCTAAIEVRCDHRTNPAGSGAPSANIFTNLTLGAALPRYLTDGILYSRAAGANDANNDQGTFIGISGGIMSGSLFRFTHSQSKAHHIYDVKAQWCGNVVSTVDNTGNGNAGGSFSVFGGTAVACSDSVFVNWTHREAINIVGVSGENNLRLFEQKSGSSGLYAVNIIGCSNIGPTLSMDPNTGAVTTLDAATDEIIYFSAGTLTVRGCKFQRHLANGADAPTKGRIKLALNSGSFGRAVADVSFNTWDTAGTYEVRDTLVDRNVGSGLGHVVHFVGNKGKNAGGTTQLLPSRRYGDVSYMGAFATADRPTGDLMEGDLIYETDLDALMRWSGSAWVGTTSGGTP